MLATSMFLSISLRCHSDQRRCDWSVQAIDRRQTFKSAKAARPPSRTNALARRSQGKVSEESEQMASQGGHSRKEILKAFAVFDKDNTGKINAA